MTTSESILLPLSGSLATRESGARIRALVTDAFACARVVTLDFAEATVTPSFADELLGKLAEQLGARAFRARIRAVGLTDDTRQLLNQVVSRRLAGGAPDRESTAA